MIRTLIEAMDRYERIPPEDWKAAESLFSPLNLRKGEFLTHQGETGFRKIAFIASGGVRHFHIDGKGEERTTDFCLASEFTGTLELFRQGHKPSQENITAIEDTSLLTTEIGQLERFLARNLRFMGLFGKVMLDYFRLKNRREKDLLGTDAPERYERFMIHYPGLSERIPQYIIASFLGMTPETLSRIRAKR
jgi:CRP-like cAMP-binding protein